MFVIKYCGGKGCGSVVMEGVVEVVESELFVFCDG